MMMNLYPFEANEARQMDIVADFGNREKVKRRNTQMIRPNDRLLGIRQVRTKIPCTRDLLAFRGPGFGSGKERWGSLRKESRDLRLSHHILTPFLPLSDAYSQLVRNATRKRAKLCLCVG
jgi:hypothetical protein